MTQITNQIAAELAVRPEQVQAVIDLLGEGATVPFIARYRKHLHGDLDDQQIRVIEERRGYLVEMNERRETILGTISEQGKLTDELKATILRAATKAELEDLYLPYRPKRRTKAQIALEAGLGPLADALLAHPERDPNVQAGGFLKPDAAIDTPQAALEGARAILSERFSEDAKLLGRLRDLYWRQGELVAKVKEGKEEVGSKFRDLFDYASPLMKAPSHRVLAAFRGEKEDFLDVRLRPEPEEGAVGYISAIASHFKIADKGRPGDRWLLDTARWAWRTKIELHLNVALRMDLWERAEREAIELFAVNLRSLLFAAPAGSKRVLALDPGFKAGVKMAVMDATGRVLDFATVYPFVPHHRSEEAQQSIRALIRKHSVELIAIGNGTASRETERLVAEILKRWPDIKATKVVVSEAGASVYSASEYASRELPDLDVSIRGAVSIGRRLQDPMAELIKIEPRSIGVGSYQHDVSQTLLAKRLDATVEDTVNAIGVELNTASSKLLARVSGIGESLAENIVSYRDANGPFRNREALRNVPRLGPKAFELAAGFLRIQDSDQPLDRSGVHPEAYPVVDRILSKLGDELKSILGNSARLSKLRASDFADERFPPAAVADILTELAKPGRDPRPDFRTVEFADGVEDIKDLEPGMVLPGIVTNIVNYGVFVDLGVHLDGLVHISQLSSKGFVKDPNSVVKIGEAVRVRVVEVDLPRKRISLSMRLGEANDPAPPKTAAAPGRMPKKPMQSQSSNSGNAFAEAFARAGLRK